jgi:hypothetical protein
MDLNRSGDPLLEVIGNTWRYLNAIVYEIKEYSKSLGFRIGFWDARAVEPFLRL